MVSLGVAIDDLVSEVVDGPADPASFFASGSFAGDHDAAIPVITVPIEVITMADRGDHDAAIEVITMGRHTHLGALEYLLKQSISFFRGRGRSSASGSDGDMERQRRAA